MTDKKPIDLKDFESQDCTTKEKLVVKAGGKIIRPKMSIGKFGFASIFMDIDGKTMVYIQENNRVKRDELESIKCNSGLGCISEPFL